MGRNYIGKQQAERIRIKTTIDNLILSLNGCDHTLQHLTENIEALEQVLKYFQD